MKNKIATIRQHINDNVKLIIVTKNQSAQDIHKIYSLGELNFGQFANHLRTKFPEYTFEKYNKVQGFPFTTKELMEVFESNL